MAQHGKYTDADVQGKYTDADVADVTVQNEPAPIGADGKPLEYIGTNKAGIPQYRGKPQGTGRNVMDFRSLAPYAPAALGTAGGIVGGVLAGPPGAVLGATYGGYAGTGISRDVEGKPRSATAEALGGAEQGAYELAGAGAGKLAGKLLPKAGEALSPVARKIPGVGERLSEILKPTERLSPKAAQYLTAAASEKSGAGAAYKAIKNAQGEVEQAVLALPKEQRTAAGYLSAVSRQRQLIHDEFENALGPAINQRADVGPIIQNLKNLKKSWMNVASAGGREGEAELKAIDNEILKFESSDRTNGQLDSLRQQLNSDLGPYYSKSPNNKYIAANSNIQVAIDEAVVSGARDSLYPVADKMAQKPEGYFRDALNREGSLIQLRGILDKRVEDLAGKQAVEEVTPRFSHENLSLSAHAGSAPRLGIYSIRNMLAPQRSLTAAGKNVARAVTTDLNSMPYEVLFSNIPRAEEAKKKRLRELLTPVSMQ